MTLRTPALVQRKCSCGKSGGAHECEQCRNARQKIQRATRSPGRQADSHAVPLGVYHVLASPGRPLDNGVRRRMESRFQHDFSAVRVHSDATAGASANEIDAMAYTVGRDVVFAPGAYAPHTTSGTELLAHELAHVVQQTGHSPTSTTSVTSGALELGPPDDHFEREADRAASRVAAGADLHGAHGAAPDAGSAGRVQRRLVVRAGDRVPAAAGGQPVPLTAAVQGLLADTCPQGQFQVDPMSGVVTSRFAQFCQVPPPPAPWLHAAASSTPAGCRCLCDVVNNTQTTTIAFRAGAPGTGPGSVAGAGAGQGGVRTDATVQADPRFHGQYLINGVWVDIPFHLILAHEICGHALPKMEGTHAARGPAPANGTPPSERQSVDVERDIAAEHNPPLPRRPEDYSGGARPRP
jgi:hypothetical protein